MAEAARCCCGWETQTLLGTHRHPPCTHIRVRLGVHGSMLAAIQSLYSTASVAVSIQGRIGPTLPSLTGVRQGCPLSPTLFGLLGDGLHRLLQATVSLCGIHILSNSHSITDLGYADDFALVSSSAVGLQQLINAADQWCGLVGMQLSQEKTVVVELTDRGPSFLATRAWGAFTASAAGTLCGHAV